MVLIFTCKIISNDFFIVKNIRHIFYAVQAWRAKQSSFRILFNSSFSKKNSFIFEATENRDIYWHIRRTAVMLVVDIGANVLQLKLFGGWNFSAVAKVYVESSLDSQFGIVV